MKKFFNYVLLALVTICFALPLGGSVGVRSPTEINAPRGCAVILIGICQLC